jgi:hypothetical protein
MANAQEGATTMEHHIWMEPMTLGNGFKLPSDVLTMTQVQAVGHAIEYIAIEMVCGAYNG